VRKRPVARALAAPRLGSGFVFAMLPGDGAVIWSDREVVPLAGAVYERLVPLIDGVRTAEGLVDLLEADFAPEEVYFALRQIERSGVLEGSPNGQNESAPPSVGGSFDSSPNVPPRAVSLVSVSTLASEQLGAALAGAALPPTSGASPTVVIVDDYLDPSLDRFNAEALADSLTWYPAKLAGSAIWLGPLIRPGITACWQCLAVPLRRNRAGHEFVRRRTGKTWHPPANPMAAWLDAGARRLRIELDRAVSVDSGCDPLVVFDPIAGTRVEHVVRRRSQCPVCGARRPTATVGPTMAKPAIVARGTGWRSESSAEFLSRHRHLVDPLMGLAPGLRRLETVPGNAIHVVVAGSNPARVGGSIEQFRGDIRAQCAGKGATAVDAEASALGEAIERHSGTFQGDETTVRSTAQRLGSEAILPNDVLLYSDRQYLGCAQWNRLPWAVAHVPPRFDPARDYDWTPLWSLTRGAPRYLPTAMLYYGHPELAIDSPFRVDSNGCAVGATAEEAILAGLFELIERDAAAIWWYHRLLRPGIPLGALGGDYGQSLTEVYRGLGREWWALDLTSDLGIPVVAAVSRLRRGDPERLVVGLGAHLDGRIALLRAVTEMNQMLAVTTQFTDAGEIEITSALRWWLGEASTAEQPQLLPAGTRPSEWPSFRPEGIADPVGHCRQILERQGLEVLVLDQTRLDFGAPAFRVVVPGLRPLHPRFGPGRLYQVPVRLGDHRVPGEEEALNSTPLCL